MSPGVVSRPSIAKARRLRKEMTEGEKHLWSRLRLLRNSDGIHVRKQVPFGPYVADFAIHAAKLIIEVDGPVHSEETQQQKDKARDVWFESAGYRVVRFKTEEVMSAWSRCVERILTELRSAN